MFMFSAGRIVPCFLVVFSSCEHTNLAKVELFTPDADDIPVPKQLKWDAIPGAKHYQVFIKDQWEGKLIHSSSLLFKPVFDVPKGLLKPGGYYSWRVYARDVNENVILGDFNHGSLTDSMEFTLGSD
jgi:hypothetical protein